MPDCAQWGRRRTFAFACLSLLMWLSTRDAVGQPASQVLEGILTVVWGDPAPGNTGGEVRYSLALDDGRIASLQMPGLEATALRYFGTRVSITGRAAADQVVAGEAPTAGVFVVEAIAAAQDFFSPMASVGTKKVIYLLVKFSDDSAVPHPPSFFTNLNNPDTPPPGEVFPATLNGFFKKTSYDQFSWVGDVGGSGGIGAPGGWLTLPHPKSYYAPCGWGLSCAQLHTLSVDAVAHGKAAGIDFRNYDNINFVLSNDLDCCAWGGGFFDAVDNKAYGATWQPPWGQETGTYAHEMGHSLGLPHSGWVYYAYDSPWDMMSARRSAGNSTTCGTYVSKNSGATNSLVCTEPGNGYIMPHKDALGWIPPANLVTVNTSSVATVTLQAGALPLTSAIKVIKVCLAGFSCSGAGARFLTVEARVKALGSTSQFDNGILGEGVIIHDVRMDRPAISGPCYFNNQSGWALPVDSSPADYEPAPTCGPGSRVYPDYALFNAQWTAGQTFVDNSNSLTITVVSRSGSTFVVTVANNPTPAITGHPAGQTVASGQTASLVVAAVGAAPLVYQWYQGASGDASIPVPGGASSTYVTAPRTTTARFWARVSNGYGSADSESGTVTVGFTDNTLISGSTIIKGTHLTELRTRVDALRVRFGLTAFSWTNPLVIAGATRIFAIHFAELRTALLQAYGSAGVAAPSFTDPTLVAGATVVKRVHIDELRNAVHSLEAR